MKMQAFSLQMSTRFEVCFASFEWRREQQQQRQRLYNDDDNDNYDYCYNDNSNDDDCVKWGVR